METLFSGRSEAEEARAGKSLFCISAMIAEETIRLTGKTGAWAEFHGWKTPLLGPSTGSNAVYTPTPVPCETA
jgi:hypothetical protein